MYKLRDDVLDILNLDSVLVYGDFLEGSELKIVINDTKTIRRRVSFNRRDGLYFVLKNTKIFDFDLEFVD